MNADVATPDLSGRTVLITGSASGMGALTAVALARQGAQLVLVDKDEPEGQEIALRCREQPGNGGVEFFACDLADFRQLRALAAEVLERYPDIHVLINNAGITESVRKESAQGQELTMATNYLAPFLLSQLLADRLQASAPARLINISSDAHKMVREMDFDDIDNREGWDGVNHNKGFQAYARSKLALAAVSFRQAEQLAGTGVDVFTVSPGYFIRTNIHRNMRGLWKLGVKLFWPLLQSPERAARTYIYLAGAPEVTGDTGHYWEHLAHKEASPLAHDAAVQERFWNYAVEQTVAPSGSSA